MPGFDPLECHSSDGSIDVQGGAALDFRIAQGASASTKYVPPGEDMSAVIEALVLDGYTRLLFGDGVYELEAPLFSGLTPDEVSGVQLLGLGDGRTVFTASYAPVVGLADDPTNALVQLFGAVDGLVSTTVAAGVPAMYESHTFTVTSAAGIAAGTFLRVMAHNNPTNPTDMFDMSDGASVILTEMLEVESVLGAVVTARAPLRQWHTPGAAVASVSPVLDVLIRGIWLDCEGGSIACGVSLMLARGVVIEDCWFRGFSRAGVNIEDGTSSVEVTRPRLKGECNSLVLLDSALGVVISGVKCDEVGARFHPNGIARWLVTAFERATDLTVADSVLQHGCGGICKWGGVSITVRGVEIRDMDPARIRATFAEFSGPTAALGVGMNGGAGSLGIESFAWAETYEGVAMHDCFGTAAEDFAWYWHDARACQVSRVGIFNHGPRWGTVVNGKTFRPQGLRVGDVQGVVESLAIHGCTYAFVMYGTPDIAFGTLKLDGVAGDGPNLVPMLFDHTGFSSLRIQHLIVNNYNSDPLAFGAQFAANPDWTMRFERMSVNGAEWGDVTVYRSNAAVGLQGAVMVIDPTSPVGTKQVIASTAASARCVCLVSPIAAGGFSMASPLPARYATARVSGAGVAGDILESDALNQAVINNAALDGTRIGRLQESKAAGVALARVVSVD